MLGAQASPPAFLPPYIWWLTRAGGDARAPSTRSYLSSTTPLKINVAKLGGAWKRS